MAGKGGSEEEPWLSGGLKPCTGGNKPAAEEAGKEGAEEKLLMSGGLRPCNGRNKLAAAAAAAEVESGKEGLRSCSRHGPSVAGKEKIAEEALIRAKRKAGAETAGGSSDGAMDAPGADASVEAASGDGGKDAPPKRKFVEMPKSLLAWILSQERETGPLKFPILSPEENEEDRQLIAQANALFQRTQAMDDEFFEFQAWVREKYKKNGRVMCPEEFLRGIPGYQ